MTPTRILLVDDHAVVRTGYRRLLELDPQCQVVAEFADGDSAYDALQRQPPEKGPLAELLVLDLSMPGRSGLDLLRRLNLRWPSLKVLVFSMHDSPAMVGQAFKAGAHGFVTKSSQPAELVDAVRRVMAGERVLSSDLAEQALPTDAHQQLSAREFDVLRFLVQGLAVDEIAPLMNLSAKTVANYQTQIRQKLGVANAVELLRYAREHGLD